MNFSKMTLGWVRGLYKYTMEAAYYDPIMITLGVFYYETTE